MRTTCTLVSILALAISGCSPMLGIRDNVYRAQPLWEAAVFGTGDAARHAAASVAPPPAPGYGLPALEQQVLGAPVEPAGVASLLSVETADLFAANDAAPLPVELAGLEVTRAVVESAGSVCRSEPVPDRKLSVRELRRFGETMLDTTLAVYQDPDGLDLQRLERIATFVETGKINWEGLAWAYFTAYYKGDFVDRTGGKLSKPSIGMKIPNETITSAITVGLEAIYDYALLSCRLRNPIVFKVKEGVPTDVPIPWKAIIFQTKDKATPTLVGVIQRALGQPEPEDGQENPPLVQHPFALEALQTDETQPGITKSKLDWIRFASGIASEAGGAASDLIIRTFGGAGGAFVAFGKLSVGDNDTLAKIVQTFVDVTVRRTTEAAVSQRLYSLTRSDQGALAAGEAGLPDPAAALLGYQHLRPTRPAPEGKAPR